MALWKLLMRAISILSPPTVVTLDMNFSATEHAFVSLPESGQEDHQAAIVKIMHNT